MKKIFAIAILGLLILGACGPGAITPTVTPSDTPTETPTATPDPNNPSGGGGGSGQSADDSEDTDTSNDSEESGDDDSSALTGPSSGIWLWVPEPHTITCNGVANTYPATNSEEVTLTTSDDGQQISFSNAGGTITMTWNDGNQQYEGTVTRTEEGTTVEVLYTAQFGQEDSGPVITGTVTWQLDACSFYREYTMTPVG